ncbi:uncharacterized protein UBRO2_03511 [Ustilago bromivora]|nr:uncharacterized protein UBRO2_03511 [Ustilago bromivora]
MNPFKRRQQRKAAAAAAAQAYPSSPPPTDYSSFPSTSRLPPRPGIFIASGPAAPLSSYHSRQSQHRHELEQQHSPSSPLPTSSTQQSLDHVLPPTSDYRQSLIMPHLTRRFTLLRAPDGSLVSPDAMRAHLRAQRARARAANIAVGTGTDNHVNFLTEDEENEIIEQLKAQARAEGRDFDLEKSSTAAAVDSWRNGYAAGTDGFGSWVPTTTNGSNQLSTLAQALGELSSNNGHSSVAEDGQSSSAWFPARKAGGSSFTGRTAERDQAYFRSANKECSSTKADEPRSPPKTDSAMESSRDAPTESATANSYAPKSSTSQVEASETEEHPMPGSFLPTNGNDSTSAPVMKERSADASSAKPLLDVPGISDTSRTRTSQGSNLLTTLSPEAFKRVSTALDEVFGLIVSERGPSPARIEAASPAALNHRPQRSSMESEANPFASALDYVRRTEAKQTESEVEESLSTRQPNEEPAASDNEDTADRAIAGLQPTLDAAYIEQGRLAVASPLPGPLPGSLPAERSDSVNDSPESQAASQPPTLTTSDSVQTVIGTSRDAEESQAGLVLPQHYASSSQHLSVSGHSVTGSSLTRPSDRSSTATATEVPDHTPRIVSTASTIEGYRPADGGASLNSNGGAPEPSAVKPEPQTSQHQLEEATRPYTFANGQQPIARPDPKPDMPTRALSGSPARSTLSRGDSIVSAGSMRSSLTGPSASYQSYQSYQGSHSRKSSADRLALARSMAPHPHLREQPSLSSIRRNYRQHVRSQTGSSEGSLLGGHASRRLSGAMSPPVLSRSARSPNYFPPPSSSVSMHDYASGFKPPSAVSPAAAAALQSMVNQPNQSPQPMQSFVMDASNALKSAQSMRNSASINQSIASPHVPSFAAFASGTDRAAATSSPETGTTSVSLHQRNASLSSNKQQPQSQSTRVSTVEDGVSSSMYAPRPAPMPEVASQAPQHASAQPTINEQGLMPNPPSDPEQAERWRAIYGIKAADAASLRASSEDVTADPNEEEDLWAKMASAPEQNGTQRPVSNFAPSIAEERLAGTGITFDQIADMQSRLIQTANGSEVIPPLPRIQADHQYNHQQQEFTEAKSKGLASPNMVFGTGSNWSQPTPNVQASNSLGLERSNGESIDTNRNAPMLRNTSSTYSHDPLSPRAVMYDVTTSHRPTSPPLHSRSGSLTGLPSLLELNSSTGHRNRESFSLSQAVDQASRMTRQPTLTSSSIAEDPDSTTDLESQYAVANPVQEHSFNVGYTSPSTSTGPRSGNNFTFPRKDSQILDHTDHSPRSQHQQFPPEDVWDRYGPQHGGITPDIFKVSSPGSPLASTGADPTSLHDDIAAQTSAATRALKGTDDGFVPTPPFRTKSISRKKSFKKVSKQISSPQLISTTQKLDHTTQIPPTLETSTSNKASKRSNRSPGWGSIGNFGTDNLRSHAKASPSGASHSDSTSKNSGYFHRRRSSSFGHEASPNDSFGLSTEGAGTPSAAGEQSNGERSSDVHPNHPYMNGGVNGGSLSRLFSKINRKKSTDQGYGGATIEPFPPELIANARATEHVSQQVPKTPELPNLPPVERTTPWTLSRMPSSVSSDRGSSIRSPTSPMYILPIDSTSTPRNKSKKKCTPIVLKRESEVTLPGDPGYIPTTIIVRSTEERARELAEMPNAPVPWQQQSQDVSELVTRDEALQSNGLLEQSTDTALEPAERMNYSQGEKFDTLAPVANVKDDEEALTPRPTSPPPAEKAQVDEGDATVNDAADATIPAVRQQDAPQEVAEAAELTSKSNFTDTDPKAAARKSLRDTIVRRTIIIPAGIDFNEQRRSFFASASRKSRRFASAEDEPVPDSGHTSKSLEPKSEAESSPTTMDVDMPVNDTKITDQPQPQEESMSTFNSKQTLHPGASLGGISRSNRASRVESSYAESLYDMYIGGENVEFGSPGSDVQELGSGARRSLAPGRASRMPETRRHIEVTERADGSVVWQVIAGLADRGSVYSDFDPRHSRHFSDASGSAVDTNFSRDSIIGDMLGAGEQEETLNGVFHTPAGLTDEDSRSFFTRPRGGAHKKSFSFDRTELMPELPRSAGVRQVVFEIANPPLANGDGIGNDTSEQGADTDAANLRKAASPTRIVYHNDAQLASLLDVLAKGKDSAKFQFHIGPNPANGEGHGENTSASATGEDSGLLMTPQPDGGSLSTWTKHEIFDADDIESHRSRVEAEIYTLLNQPALLGRTAQHQGMTSAAGEAGETSI